MFAYINDDRVIPSCGDALYDLEGGGKIEINGLPIGRPSQFAARRPDGYYADENGRSHKDPVWFASKEDAIRILIGDPRT